MASVTSQPLDYADEPVTRVDPADSNALHAALAVLLTGRTRHASGAVSQFVEFTERQGVALDRLWTIGPADEPQAAVLIAPNPGRTGMMFASPALRRWNRAAVVRLVRTAVAAEDPQDMTMLQALLEPDQDEEAGALLSAGFQRLATLVYLQRRPQAAAGQEALVVDGVEVRHWSQADLPLFERGVLASYEQTQDCPGLLGLRRIEDIMAGHQATGSFDPQLWTVCLIDGQPAAVMLLSELPEQRSLELVYLGVAVPHRGRGLGRRLVRHALLTAAARRLNNVVLAVDEANDPAMALYRALGFRTTSRKLALIYKNVGE